MQKIREQVLIRRDKVYQDNEGEVRQRWHFEDAVSFVYSSLSSHFCYFIISLIFLCSSSISHILTNDFPVTFESHLWF